MAAANQINLEYMNHKLEFLEKLQGHLHTAVADFIKEVVNAGKGWVAEKGDKETFLKIRQKVDNAVDFLSLKCHEISAYQHEAEASVEDISQERQHLPKAETGAESSSTVVATTTSAALTTVSYQRNIAGSSPETDLSCQVLTRVQMSEEAICSLCNNMEKVTEQQADMEKKFEDFAAKLLNINKQLSDLSVADKLQNKKLKEHTDIITEKQDEIQKQQEITVVTLREFKDSLHVTEARVWEELKKAKKQFQETETSLKAVCELLVNRLRPLEQLRSALSQRGRERDDKTQHLQELVRNVSAMSPRLTQLECQMTASAVGFSAWASVSGKAESGSVITPYFFAACNDSGHFDFKTGIFNVPVEGTYVTCISVCKNEDKDGQLRVQVTCERPKPRTADTESVCDAVSTVNFISAGGLGLIQVKAGDKLYAQMVVNNCDAASSVTFSCFLSSSSSHSEMVRDEVRICFISSPDFISDQSSEFCR